MKVLDLLRMSSSNLWRRKLRAILTILGVIIGTASIVVMISLGLGMSKSLLDSIEESGGLTTITVRSGDSGGYYMGGGMAMASTSSDSSASNAEPKRLDDEAIELLNAIPHVSYSSPVLQTSAMAKQGAYESYLNIEGMSLEALEKMDIPLGEGRLPQAGNTELEFVFGNNVIVDFNNPKKNEYYWETGVLPDVDLMNKPLFVIFDTEAYWQAQYPSEGQVVAMPKKYMINGCGLVEGSVDEWNSHSYAVYCDIEALKTTLKRVFKNKAIPGQPTTKSGKPYKELFYSQAYVYVDSMDNVKEVQSQIIAMGFQANSNIEWLESSQEQYATTQAVLGGIGAVSLFVAAIGIANTMMMSIYERTKEIGVIKVLGCNLNNIRTMFLMEAGFIGFIGGFIGILLSFGISGVINKVAGAMNPYQSTISFIPAWLAAVALGFAVLVGMVAGFFPALRAMKLSPLAAIRTE